MDFSYAITPFMAWFVAGVIKFIINSIRAKQAAFNLIGYGGLPSNHSAIVSSITTLIALKDGLEHPAFGVALTLTFIVILDAHSLRREVGRHAEYLNRLSSDNNLRLLRERIGHTRVEILAGIVTGILVSLIIDLANFD